MTTSVARGFFGKMPGNTPIEIFTLREELVEARIITYGGVLVSLKVPDQTAIPKTWSSDSTRWIST